MAIEKGDNLSPLPTAEIPPIPFLPGTYRDLWENTSPIESATPHNDPAVARLYDLASIPESEPDYPLYWFMRDFVTTNDPVIEHLYGNVNRLAGIQYFIDKKVMEINGQEVPLTLGTWSADVRFESDAEAKRAEGVRKLNEDALLVRPFGEGRMLAAVFDGASSQKPVSGLATRELKGSWYVSHLAAMGFPTTSRYQELAQDPNTTAKDVVVEMNRWLKTELSRVPGVDYADVLTIPGMAATVALIDYPKNHISIAHVADTIGIVEHKDKAKIVTNNLNAKWDSETYKLVLGLSQELRVSPRKIAEMKHPLVLQQLAQSFREKINTPIGTGIVNGMPELETIPGLIQTADLEITPDLLALHFASDGWHMAWTGRENYDNGQSATKSINAAMHSPYFRPDHPAYKSLERLGLDPEHWAIARLAHDDATLLSVGLQGRESDQDTEYRKNGRYHLMLDYPSILNFYLNPQKFFPGKPSEHSGLDL